MQRFNARVQLLAFAVAGAGIAAVGKTPLFYEAIGGLLLLVGLAYWNRSKRGMEHINLRVAELENSLNQLCAAAYGTNGTPPFQWENRQMTLRAQAPKWTHWL